MPLTDFLEALPEDRREAYKAEISKAVIIASEADAETFAANNELLRKANQRWRDQKFEATKQEFVKNFHEKELPALLDAERKKGQKTPLELEVEQMKAERAAEKRELALERQKNKALAKAQSLGLIADEAFIAKFIGETDEETEAGLEYLAKTLVPYRDNAVQAALKNLGSQPAPRGGVVTADDFSKLSQTELMAFAKRGPAEEKQVLEWMKQRK